MFTGFEAKAGVLVMVGVWSSDIDDGDVGVRNQVFVGSVRFCMGRGGDFLEEGGGARQGRGGGSGHKLMADVGDVAGGRGEEEVFCEGWTTDG